MSASAGATASVGGRRGGMAGSLFGALLGLVLSLGAVPASAYDGTCSCPHGTVTTNPSICNAWGPIACDACDEPYVMSQMQCYPVCTCSHGVAAIPEDCPSLGADVCAACYSGYVRSNATNGSCVPVCNCRYGTGANGSSCPSPGALKCASCFRGYALNGTTCVQACTCRNGTGATGSSCPSPGLPRCISCDAGYALLGSSCYPACTCRYGTAAIGARCMSTGAEVCASCSAGYVLNGTSCIPACTCLNGTGATGSSCPSPGAAACASCNASYVLRGTNCVPVPCMSDGDCDSDELCQLPPAGSASNTGSCIEAANVISCNTDADCDAGTQCFQLDDKAPLKLPPDVPRGICIMAPSTTPTTTTTVGRGQPPTTAMNTTTAAATTAGTAAGTTLPAVALTTTLPAVALTTTLPAVALTTTLPAAARTTTLPAVVAWTTTLPEVALTTTLPAVAFTTTLPARALTTTLPAVALTTTLPAVALTTTLQTTTTTGFRATTTREAETTTTLLITTTTWGRSINPPTATSTVMTTRTTTTVTTVTKTTTTQDPSYCALPGVGPGLDTSDCLRKYPPATCSVKCPQGYAGVGSQYTCSAVAAGFVGTPPTCTSVTKTTTTRATTTTTKTLPRCGRVQSGLGINSSDCANKVAGTNCTLTCNSPYTGEPKTLICDDSGTFQGDKITCAKLHCTAGLPASGYDVSACGNQEVGWSCQVTCLPGYIPKRSTFVCQSNGSFTGEPPTCTRVNCTRLPSGEGVNDTDCQRKQFGENCTATCRDSYNGTSVPLTCGSNGWFFATGGGESDPTCSLKSCSVPDALTTGTTLTHNCGGSVSFGRGCFVSCVDGYSGTNKAWTCGGSGPTLTGTLPTCTANKCTRRPPSGEGVNSTDCANTTTGQNCTAFCAPGFDANGSGTVTCLSNGAFTGSTLVCARKACAALTTISGFVNPPVENTCGGKLYKQTCAAKCTDGYASTSGASSVSLTCSVDGTFTNDTGGPPNALNCVPAPCTVGAPNLLGVTSNCTGKTTGQTCTASATPGYRYVAGTTAKTLTCQTNGAFAWDNGTVQVEPGTCDAKPTWGAGIQNTCDGLTYRETCYAYCGAGYRGGQRYWAQYKCDFNGSILTIQPDPDLQETPLTCTRGRRLQGSGAACPTVPNISASMQTDCTANQASGTSCIVECASGYNISGSPTLLACTDGIYSPTTRPTCIPIPCTFNAPDGVGVTSDCNGTGTGSNCTAQCGPGYTGSSVTFTCNSNGQFSGTSPTCTALACSAPSLGSQYATTDCANKTTGKTCLVGCADGYTLTGSPATDTCGTSQAFTGTVPNCTAAMCTSGVPTGGDLNVSAACSTLTTGQTCSVACANGYSGAATTFTCGSSGSLTGTAPTCTLQTCTDLSPGANFSHTCTSKTMGTSCTVGCASGYQLAAGQSAQTFQCAWDASAGKATLQGSLPTCTGIPCVDNIPTGDTITQNCGSVPTGSTCSASCLPGYTGIPPTSTLTCLASGALSGTVPMCAKMNCTAYQSTTSYDASLCSAVVFGDSCLVSCQPGYSGTAASLACQLNLANTSVVLTGSPPTCTAMQCIYNLPQGSEFQHNCSGRVAGESCLVSCAAGWAGTPTSLSCGTDQMFNGTMPTCVIVTTTRTSTTLTDTSTTVTETSTTITMTTTKTATRTITSSTSTVTTTTRTGTTTMTTTRTRTVTTRVNATEKVTTVEGSMKLQVADPVSFVSDPDAKAAVEQGIAAVAGVPAAYVNATLSVVDTGRRLAAGNTTVEVAYTIGIPDSMSSNLPPIDSILANLTTANATSMKAAISAALDAITPGKYAVSVLDLRPPQGPDDGSVMVKTSSSDDKKKKTGIIVGCVVGIVGGCGCVWGLGFVLYRCFRGRDDSRGLVREGSQGTAEAVQP